MREIALDCIAIALSEIRGISCDEAKDIINHTLSVCSETLYGETDYADIADVIDDYLSLGSEWTKLFVPSE